MVKENDSKCKYKNNHDNCIHYLFNRFIVLRLSRFVKLKK